MGARSGGSNRTIAISASTSTSARNARKPYRMSSATAVRVAGPVAVLNAAPATSRPFVLSTSAMPFYTQFLAIVSL